MDFIGWHYTFINLTRNRCTLRKIARFVVFFFFNIMFSRVDGNEQKRNIFSCYFLFKKKSYYKIIQRNQNGVRWGRNSGSFKFTYTRVMEWQLTVLIVSPFLRVTYKHHPVSARSLPSPLLPHNLREFRPRLQFRIFA